MTTRSRARQVLVALVTSVVTGAVIGCAPAAVQEPSLTASPSPSPDLLTQRRALGIPACPESDPDVAARPDGLPDVSVSCLGGDSQVRLAGLRGRPLIINLWAQWCDPCRREAPYLADYMAEAGGEVEMLGIDFNDPRPDEALRFAAEAGWTWAHMVDPDRALAGPLKITGVPQTLFVTAEGAIAYRHIGEIRSTQQIKDLASEYLGVE